MAVVVCQGSHNILAASNSGFFFIFQFISLLQTRVLLLARITVYRVLALLSFITRPIKAKREKEEKEDRLASQERRGGGGGGGGIIIMNDAQ